jgi:trehalose synthase
MRPLIVRDGGPPPEDRPLVVQVSRWDPVKDMTGVLTAFAEVVAHASDADLVLVGPEVDGVADDPEAGDYFAECVRLWEALPPEVRGRVHLVCLPMADPDANAEAVNAVQRHAAVVTQKSRSEGFGLTVAEAMWKEKAVVCTRVGGLHLQIPDRAVGVPVPAVDDLRAFGDAVVALLSDDDRRGAIGRRAKERVREEFLLDKHLLAELDLVSELHVKEAA